MNENPKYDVAISFLASDENIASALCNELSRSLDVFFFPRKQDELAGTDGMESMRTPFLQDSRVMVVLYREKWGKTRWTSIEETAIKEACFNGDWKRLFFVVLDRNSALPKWLPEYHVRYNLKDFGIEQAVGAIKARVLENGGEPSELTPLKRAELLRADELYRADRSRLKSEAGIPQIQRNLIELLQQIENECEQIKKLGYLEIRHEVENAEGSTYKACYLTNDRVGIKVFWFQRYVNVPQDAYLSVHEFNTRLLFPSEIRRGLILTVRSTRISEDRYEPELSRAGDYGWKEQGASMNFLSSKALAQKIVVQFVELVDRYQSGEIEPPSF